MAFSEELASRIRKSFDGRTNVKEMKMFGGVGFMLNGNMLVGVWNDSLIVRLSQEEAADALQEIHVKAFDITGRPMKGWLLVDAEALIEETQLEAWIQRASNFVETLPAK